MVNGGGPKGASAGVFNDADHEPVVHRVYFQHESDIATDFSAVYLPRHVDRLRGSSVNGVRADDHAHTHRATASR